MDYEISKLLPVKPERICPWCCGALQPEKHLIPRTRAMYRCPQCGQATNYGDITSSPTMYKAMLENERARLDDWVMDHFTLSDEKSADAENTYVLKHRYQVQTDMYLYSGCLNGALLHLGFRPRNTLQTNWLFDMRWKKPDERSKHADGDINDRRFIS